MFTAAQDMIMSSYKRQYVVNTLTYVDVFMLTRTALDEIIRHDEFPRTKVKA